MGLWQLCFRGGEDAGVFTTDVALLGSSVSCEEQRGGNGASLMEVDALHCSMFYPVPPC